ncbi:hypothetical protein NP493_389g00037 [Ridgeia piscesae]|uniref:Uncharacterized protein n=1 Tax=Ridgeia piscesae TaxID=27915 RepID=A0AAD9L1Z9_RIDPI|nr:hypothetical protein NP493_389g00037 [Ridgeia piscesae]
MPGTADGGRRTADGGRRTADGGRRTADGGRRTADGGRRTADGGRRTADGGRRTADGGRRTADGGRRTADGGRRTGASACACAGQDPGLSALDVFGSEPATWSRCRPSRPHWDYSVHGRNFLFETCSCWKELLHQLFTCTLCSVGVRCVPIPTQLGRTSLSACIDRCAVFRSPCACGRNRVTSRLKSRSGFAASTEPIDTASTDTRVKTWQERLDSLDASVHKNIRADEHLSAGCIWTAAA